MAKKRPAVDDLEPPDEGAPVAPASAHLASFAAAGSHSLVVRTSTGRTYTLLMTGGGSNAENAARLAELLAIAATTRCTAR